MSKTIEFYYDYGSPTAYLAWTQLPAVAERAGARLVRRPILLGGVFKATGNRSPVTIEAKGRWMLEDLHRFAGRYGVVFNMNPHFIVNTLAVMRGAVFAEQEGFLEAYDSVMFEAMWVRRKNLAEPEIAAAELHTAGIGADAVLAGMQAPEVKQALIERTEAAVARGVFGVPTCFVGDEMHFGQDRLDWVEAALAA